MEFIHNNRSVTMLKNKQFNINDIYFSDSDESNEIYESEEEYSSMMEPIVSNEKEFEDVRTAGGTSVLINTTDVKVDKIVIKTPLESIQVDVLYEKGFGIEYDLNTHDCKEHRKEHINCDNCEKGFGIEYYLNTHDSKEHRKEQINCDKCDFKFKLNKIVDMQLDIVHNKTEDKLMVPKGPASFLFVRNKKSKNIKNMQIDAKKL